MLLAGCATDGSTLLTSADPAAPVAAEETEAPPPAATTAPPPARSTTASKPRQTEKDKKAAKKPEKKPAPAAAEASAPAAAPASKGKFTGSWQFSNGQKACMMTLSGGGSGGAVSASGECWNAYAKAKGWKLQGNEMVLTDGNQPIAKMQSTGETRYDGYGADGEPVVLVR